MDKNLFHNFGSKFGIFWKFLDEKAKVMNILNRSFKNLNSNKYMPSHFPVYLCKTQLTIRFEILESVLSMAKADVENHEQEQK